MLKKTFTGLLLLSGLWAGSCKDSDEEVQIDVKNIQVTGLEEGAEVWNTAELSVTAENQEGIQQIDFYVGDESIASDKTAPYEFTWNTREYEDGEYTVKMVVVTTGGKTVEKTLTVQVKNTLLTVTMDDNYLREGETCYVVLSDTLGKVLSYQKIGDATSYTFAASEDYEGNVFDLNVVAFFTKDKAEEYDVVNHIASYVDVRRGSDWHLFHTFRWLEGVEDWLFSDSSEKTLEFENIPAQEDFESIYFSSAGEDTYHKFENHQDLSNFESFRQSDSWDGVLVQIKKPDGLKYRFFDGMTSQSVNTLDLNQVNLNTEEKTFVVNVPESIDYYHMDLYGYKTGKEESQKYALAVGSIQTPEGFQPVYYYPEGVFENFATRTHHEFENGSNTNFLPGMEPSFDLIEGVDYSIEQKSFGEITLKVQGELDFGLFLSGIINGEEVCARIIFAPKSNRTFYPIDFPEEIQSKIPKSGDLTSEDVAVYDFLAIEGYEEALKFLSNPVLEASKLKNKYYREVKYWE
ncbi:Ig-like domain-containing protein [Rapidithrix thailandica]|uniref:Ig-like domain-containing protein n=1 Tax=Rapidithrix thailandica TaxID=413964 RepID=A0AAW9SGZ9_9BACT